MIKKHTLVLIAFICFFVFGYGQGSESFTNSNATGTYADNNFASDNGVTWTYIHSRDESIYGIAGKGLILRRASGNSKVTSSSVIGGISNFTCSLRKAFTGTGNRQAELFINGSSQGTSIQWDNTNVQTFTVNNINISGNVIIELRNITANQVIVDDISWTAFSSSNPNLTITGTPANHGSVCVNTAATSVQYTITNSGTLQADGITLTSDDTQFVISGLSSTTIAASSTATYNVTFTPTSAGIKNALITVASTTGTSNYPTSNLTGTGITTPTITTQPTNQNIVIPNTTTFNVAATNAISFQWQVSTNGGSVWNNVTGGTGAATVSYTTVATTEPMNGYQYRCVTTNTCGSINSNVATLTLTNSSPNNATGLTSCIGENSIDLNWNASTGALTPTGYIVFAQPGTIIPAMPTATAGNASGYVANLNYTLATTYGPLGKAVYKSNATSATITGLTSGSNYTFKVIAYYSENLTGWSTGMTISGSWNQTYTIGMQNATITDASIAPTSSVITWTNPLPTSCYQILVVANQGTLIFSPTGNGSAYTSNTLYSGANQVVYKGTGNVVTVTNLVDGLQYCYSVFVRHISTNEWSSGVSICQTTGVSYCDSNGGTDDSGILNVKLNTIDNTSVSTNGYSDFSSIATNLILGEHYNLSVNVNTGGNHTSNVKVWIDWNRDGSFNNSPSSNEVFELGTSINSTDAQPSLSPIAVIVPTNISIGNIRMRVSSKSDDGEPYATPCEGFSFGEVEDYTIIVQQPTDAEINIKGNNISIANGFNAPYGLNNTLFGATNIGALGPLKTYTIENIGLATLNLTGVPKVEIIGTNGTGNNEFTVTQQPTASVTSSGTSDFIIQFMPLIQGTRTASVRILNSDSDENPYEFMIEGNATCSTVYTSTILPVEGPKGTEITISSATDLTGATTEINGLTMPIVSTTATELIVLVPADASTGNINVIFSTGCTSINGFTVIDTLIGGCETSSATALSELFISEVTDATSGSSSYVEIYNGTPNPINLSDYSLNIYNNGNTSPSSTNALTGTLAPSGIYVVSMGTTSCPLNNLSATADQSFGSSSGINFNNNSSDMIAIYKTSTLSIVDAYGVFGSNSWSNNLSTDVDGVNFRRKNTSTPLPSATFNLADWEVIDWTNCGDADYVNIGVYDFSTGMPPAVSVLNPPPSSCDLFRQLSVIGTEGLTGGLGLTYQWFYLAPGNSNWLPVPDDADFDNVTLTTLDVVNALNFDGYQFYCQVRENVATCYTASHAIKLRIEKTIWTASGWSSPPTSNKIAYITTDYDTSVGTNGETSFQACNLIVDSGAALTISDASFVEVQNNVINNGTLYIASKGSLVQIHELGTYTLNPTTGFNTLSKFTAPLQFWYDYTYWSSPLENAQIEAALFFSNANRRFYFDASKFNDVLVENTNMNTFGPGQDDIDDEGDDWTLQQTGTMTGGLGYAATHDNIGFTANNSYQYIFEGNPSNSNGAFNTGPKNVSIYITPTTIAYNDWNLIGNPYPSAISTDAFFANTSSYLEGVIYLWSHTTDANSNTSGNENANFSQDDYAMINGTGGTASNNNPGNIPTKHVPSGQGFFVIGKKSAASSGAGYYSETVFNNAMRVPGNNNQFFRTSSENQHNKLWVNLTSDNGVFNQILVGYVDGATDAVDAMYYDALRNLSTNSSTILYSVIENSDDKFAIQGKNPSSLTIDEVIPLGFYTSIDVAMIYNFSITQLEGEFLNTNIIYLKDNLMNIVHNLTDTDYSFTSETGEFNDRFEIVFRPETLSTLENEISAHDLTIIELNTEEVAFTVGNNLNIESVEIIDVLGRTLYRLKGASGSETYNLSNLSQAAYIARVKFSNGQTITKRAIKRH